MEGLGGYGFIGYLMIMRFLLDARLNPFLASRQFIDYKNFVQIVVV